MPISLIKIRRSESVTASQTSYAKLFTLMFDDLRNYIMKIICKLCKGKRFYYRVATSNHSER